MNQSNSSLIQERTAIFIRIAPDRVQFSVWSNGVERLFNTYDECVTYIRRIDEIGIGNDD